MARRNYVELNDAALQRLKRASGRDVRRLLEAPLLSSGQIIKSAAVGRAPILREPDPRRRPGELAASIKVVVDEERLRQRGRLDVRIGTDTFYALWQELGWMPRGPGNRQSWTERKTREAGQKKSGARGVGRGLSVGQPFLRPAFDMTKSAARAKAMKGIAYNIEQLADP